MINGVSETVAKGEGTCGHKSVDIAELASPRVAKRYVLCQGIR
jgi:hypothetical protein